MNLPIQVGNNVLIAGIGGGFDIYGGIPLYTNLRFSRADQPCKSFFFSNYNIASKSGEATPVESIFTKVVNKPVYTIPKSGVRPMVERYKKIVEQDQIDTIVLMDGGIDSLMRGNEDGAGTFLEDLVSMVAINELQVKKILACVGFGAEMEEGVCHVAALARMAELISNNGYYGCCALTKDTHGYDLYKECCETAWKQGRASHIQSKIISAVEGRFGDNNIYTNVDAMVFDKKFVNFISPLMSIYWFFDLPKVLEHNYLANTIKNTNTYTDALMLMRQSIDKLERVPKKQIPY